MLSDISEITDDFFELSQMEKTIQSNFNKNYIMFYNLMKTNSNPNQNKNLTSQSKSISLGKKNDKVTMDQIKRANSLNTKIVNNIQSVSSDLTPVKEIHSHLLNFNDNLINFSKNDLDLYGEIVNYSKSGIEVIKEEVNESESIVLDKGFITKLKDNNENNKNKEDFEKFYKYFILNDFFNVFEIPDINYSLIQQYRLGFNLNSNVQMETDSQNLTKFEEYNFNKLFIADKPSSLIDEQLIYQSNLILG